MLPKPRNQIPAMETIDPSVTYAFNLNPSTQYENQKKRFHICINAHTILLKLLGDDKIVTWVLHPELSPTGRVHYHGTIQIHDPFNFYIRLSKFLEQSTVVIKPITPDDKWHDYCHKQALIIKPNLKHYPLKSTYFNNLLKETHDSLYVNDITKFMVQ